MQRMLIYHCVAVDSHDPKAIKAVGCCYRKLLPRPWPIGGRAERVKIMGLLLVVGQVVMALVSIMIDRSVGLLFFAFCCLVYRVLDSCNCV
ncbi:MAG: hypothetical protein COA36_08790 [Desulfotalea sp.]|nr:MAG: hypothetical protein COA36_08790 [Desulfotalea sp.]